MNFYVIWYDDTNELMKLLLNFYSLTIINYFQPKMRSTLPIICRDWNYSPNQRHYMFWQLLFFFPRLYEFHSVVHNDSCFDIKEIIAYKHCAPLDTFRKKPLFRQNALFRQNSVNHWTACETISEGYYKSFTDLIFSWNNQVEI